jgi:hypothetical protein
MRKWLLLLALAGQVWGETWKWSDTRGNWAEVKYAHMPAQPALVHAFKERFFPIPQEWVDAEFRSSWESEVEVTLSNARYQSYVARGLKMMRDDKGEPLGAHPSKLAQTLTWDIRKQRQIGLRQLIRAESLSNLAQVIRKHCEFPEALGSRAEWDYYLTPKAVVFFDQDAPHVSFGLESVVPYGQLKSLAAPGSPILAMLEARNR